MEWFSALRPDGNQLRIVARELVKLWNLQQWKTLYIQMLLYTWRIFLISRWFSHVNRDFPSMFDYQRVSGSTPAAQRQNMEGRQCSRLRVGGVFRTVRPWFFYTVLNTPFLQRWLQHATATTFKSTTPSFNTFENLAVVRNAGLNLFPCFICGISTPNGSDHDDS